MRGKSWSDVTLCPVRCGKKKASWVCLRSFSRLLTGRRENSQQTAETVRVKYSFLVKCLFDPYFLTVCYNEIQVFPNSLREQSGSHISYDSRGPDGVVRYVEAEKKTSCYHESVMCQINCADCIYSRLHDKWLNKQETSQNRYYKKKKGKKNNRKIAKLCDGPVLCPGCNTPPIQW